MQTQTVSPQATDPTAVMGRRILAFVIDLAIGTALLLVLFFAIAQSATLASSSQASQLCDFVRETESSSFCVNFGSNVYVTDSGDSNLIAGVLLAYGIFFQFLLPGVSGYSIGKAVMGLRVVKQSDGQLAGIGANGLRWLFGIIDFGPCLLPGLITGLSTKGHRRIGDMVASTLVVDKSQVGIAPVVPGLTSPEVAPAAWTPPAPSSPQPNGSWAGAAPPAPPTADPAAPPAFPPPSSPPASPPTFPPPTTPPVTDSPPTTPPPTDSPPPAVPVADEATTAMPVVGDDTADAAMPVVGDDTADAAMPVVGDDTADAEAAAPAAETEPPPTAAETSIDEPAAPSTQLPERPVEETLGAEPAPAESHQAGVSEPTWDDARNTYIQWDPELGQWMEWSEPQGSWIPIST